jgi:non-ribosomal peptide synthetase component F
MVVDSGDIANMRLAARQMLPWLDTVLLVQQEQNEIILDLVFRKDLFTSDRAQEMLNQLEFLLEQIISEPYQQVQQRKIGSYSLVTNKSQVPNPREPLDMTWEGPITHHFHQNALKMPDKIAVVHDNTRLTYKQLDDLTSQLANYLIGKG